MESGFGDHVVTISDYASVVGVQGVLLSTHIE